MAPSTDLDATTVAEALLAALARTRLAPADDPVALAATLELATRVATLLVIERLAPLAASYPANVQALLAWPEPAIDSSRDSVLERSEFLGWRDAVDMLCAEPLPCVAPRLHRGWQDKTQSCRHARRVTRSAVGFAVDEAGARALLDGMAICNRVFVAPPPVRLDPARVRHAYLAVLDVVESAAPTEFAAPFHGLVERLRAQVAD